MYILSQVAICFSYVFLGATYLTKNRTKVLISATISIIFFMLSYGLLSAWSGLAVNAIAIVRNLLFYTEDKLRENKKLSKSKLKIMDICIFSFSIIALLVCSIFTYDGILSLMSIAASLVYTISIWQKNKVIYQILGIVSSLLWITYNTFISSIFGLILECVMVVVEIIGLIKLIKNNKKVESKNEEN